MLPGPGRTLRLVLNPMERGTQGHRLRAAVTAAFVPSPSCHAMEQTHHSPHFTEDQHRFGTGRSRRMTPFRVLGLLQFGEHSRLERASTSRCFTRCPPPEASWAKDIHKETRAAHERDVDGHVGEPSEHPRSIATAYGCTAGALCKVTWPGGACRGWNPAPVPRAEPRAWLGTASATWRGVLPYEGCVFPARSEKMSFSPISTRKGWLLPPKWALLRNQRRETIKAGWGAKARVLRGDKPGLLLL